MVNSAQLCPVSIMTAGRQLDSLKPLIAVGFGMFPGVLSANSMPVMIGAMLDNPGINEAQAKP